ncbi:hypothetical protein ACF1BE_03750 [Streptomyces sp. NPDC014991]|uniref:hypothetical protein n=1 Tax=Streptomyces sp. NPDC014991 TaxID=3364935 RepID=UPI0036FF1C56
MRDLPARRLASTALCAAVLVGITGPAAVAADTARGHGRTSSRAPVPTAERERLLAQVRALGAAGSVLNPVVDLLNRSLEKGKLPADEARRLGEAAKKAITKAAEDPTPATAASPTAPASPATPTAPAKPATPTAPASSPAQTAKPTSASPSAPVAPVAAEPAAPPAPAKADDGRPPSSRDLTDDALSALQTAVDNLVKAVTDGLDQILSFADDVVSGLVDLLGTTLLGNDMPAPSIDSLPSLPSLPVLPSLPSLPATPSPAATG